MTDNLLGPQTFAQVVGRVGIGKDFRVLVCTSSHQPGAARRRGIKPERPLEGDK